MVVLGSTFCFGGSIHLPSSEKTTTFTWPIAQYIAGRRLCSSETKELEARLPPAGPDCRRHTRDIAPDPWRRCREQFVQHRTRETLERSRIGQSDQRIYWDCRIVGYASCSQCLLVEDLTFIVHAVPIQAREVTKGSGLDLVVAEILQCSVIEKGHWLVSRGLRRSATGVSQ